MIAIPSLFEMLMYIIGIFDEFEPLPKDPVCFARTSFGKHMKLFTIPYHNVVAFAPPVVYAALFCSLRSNYIQSMSYPELTESIKQIKTRTYKKVILVESCLDYQILHDTTRNV